MAAPFFSTPLPFVYQSPQDAVTPFQILGSEAQIVQIMLKPQEKVIAKPGTICYMSGSVQMENIYAPENEAGVLQWIFGKSVTSIVLHNKGSADGFVRIAAPSLARIIPDCIIIQILIDLAIFGGEMLCQPDVFLCSINDVKINNTVDPRARNASAEGFLRQKISGQGLAILVGGGSVSSGRRTSREDNPKRFNKVRQRSIQTKNVRRSHQSIHTGENLVTAVLTGPGIVFIQSMPFHRLSQRIARSVTSPNMRENPKFFLQIAIFFFLAYVVILSSLILTGI
ncbi:Mitochondrial biogenesis AIM [Olea europaea subsp. europaea]|uniref:Mitochondrial biogenesis AIM n=1 Tax=Olea europaea subsp. europaea TaxID=158383 RepID=A0A8S0R6K0_OLEEU|nr:Mitochondrial biogenesis AIM [Olea europaea subsp. europaea]